MVLGDQSVQSIIKETYISRVKIKDFAEQVNDPLTQFRISMEI